MPVMSSDDLPNETPGQPDRTIFRPPQTVVVEPMRRSGGGAGALIAFFVMLIPCGALGFLAYSQSQAAASTQAELAALRAEVNESGSEAVAEKDAVIESLRQQVARLETQIEADDDISKMIADGENKLQEIREMLSGAKRGWGTLERRAEWAVTPVVWDEDAKKILEARVTRLEELRRQIRDWTPPATRTPSAGTIRPSD